MAERVAGGKRSAQDEASDPHAKRHRAEDAETVCDRLDLLDAKVDDLIARTRALARDMLDFKMAMGGVPPGASRANPTTPLPQYI